MNKENNSEMSDTNLEPNTKKAKILQSKPKIKKNKKMMGKKSDSLDSSNQKKAEVKEEPEKSLNKLNRTIDEHQAKILPKIEKDNLGKKDEVELLTDALTEHNKQLDAKYKCAITNKRNFKHLKLEDMIATFDLFKPMLDDICNEYKKHYSFRQMKKTAYLHLLMMSLIDSNIGVALMHHLNDNYKHNQLPCSVLLYSAFMLPEWILAIYMREFNLNRDSAIEEMILIDGTDIYSDDSD